MQIHPLRGLRRRRHSVKGIPKDWQAHVREVSPGPGGESLFAASPPRAPDRRGPAGAALRSRTLAEPSCSRKLLFFLALTTRTLRRPGPNGANRLLIVIVSPAPCRGQAHAARYSLRASPEANCDLRAAKAASVREHDDPRGFVVRTCRSPGSEGSSPGLPLGPQGMPQSRRQAASRFPGAKRGGVDARRLVHDDQCLILVQDSEPFTDHGFT